MNPFRKNRGPSQNTPRGSRPAFRPLVEGLEDRTVPASHVTASIVGGNLFLTGDTGDSQIKITGSTRGPIDIEAIDTETIINDQPGMVTLLGFRGGIFVDMGDGNDTLVISSVGPKGMLKIDMGAGDDTLTLTTATISSLIDINLGTGNDVFNLQSIGLKNSMRADAGEGDDQINISNAKMERDSLFIGGGGVDSVGYVKSKFSGIPGLNGFQQTIGIQLPRALDDSATVARGGSTIVNVFANDMSNTATNGFNKDSVNILSNPLNGSISILPDGTVSYKHNNGFTNTDSFRYTIQNDRGATSNPATVRISITGFTGPTVALATTATSPTKTNPLPYTATFSDDVTGFALSDVTLTNGTATNLVAVNAKTYTFSVVPTADGTVTVTVPAGVAANVLNLTNSASSPSTVTFDATSPVITINPLTTNDTTPSLTGTVNDSSSTVKVTVNGQTINATVSGTTWTANVTTALAEGTYPIAATATDAAGNTATANNATGLVVDVTPPTVAISSTSSSTTNLAKIPIKITFSEAVGSFTDISDIVVTGGTASNFFAELGGKVYDVDITPNAPGPITVAVNAGVANDQAGNLNSASSTFTRTSTVSTPTVAITTTASNPTSSATIPFTFTFSENVVDFTFIEDDPIPSKIVVTNGTVTGITPIDGKTYIATVVATASGAVTVALPADSVHNSGGSGNAAATPLSVVFNSSGAPTVAISSSSSNPTSTAAIPITITFDKDVTSFVASDVVVGNGTLSNFNPTADPKVYTATVTATANGAVTVDVPANSAVDSNTNGNLAAQQFSIAFSHPAPTVAITSTSISPTSSPSIPITITFSEDVTTFVAGDVVVGNGTLGALTAVDGKTYTGTITATANGNVTVDVAANVALGAFNTGNAAAPQFSIAFDNPSPSVAIATSATSPTSSPAIPITITFSEDVNNFVAGDVVVGNGTLSGFTQVDPKTYTATVTATANGAVTVDVPANVALDGGNTGNAAAPQLSVTFDNSAPTLAHAIADVSKTTGAANTVFTVSGTFDDADVKASTATLNIIQGSTAKSINLQFFDRDAPASVNNFFNYTDRYAANDGALFHRLVTQSGLQIIQGGGYAFSDLQNDGNSHIATDSPIRLEYSSAHENVKGTLAMVRTAAQDSGTSEFFFNLDDGNSSTLNGSNGGGYAVFAQVVGAADLAVLDSLKAVPTVALTNNQNSPFSTLPYLGDGQTLNPPNTVRVSSLVATHRDTELSYTVSSSNTSVVTATAGGFAGNQVTLDYGVAGTSTITVTTTDSAGHSLSTTFTVTVT